MTKESRRISALMTLPAAEPDSYFEETAPPRTLSDLEDKVAKFIQIHRLIPGRKVVLVTSGGTTVPLETQTVRFLDNFSAGTRGATSAEYFLAAGYAVIFFHRQFSLQPYSRHYSHSTNCFLDFMDVNESGDLTVNHKYTSKMKQVLMQYRKAKEESLLLMINFTTVREYLFGLRSITRIMAPLRHNAMFYLAAAVSDFFIPENKMVEHKIQSSGGGLSLELEQVPKIIRPLVKEWAPEGFIISFKLETDPSLLSEKATKSLNTYGHQVVIGNILTTRKRIVTLFFRPEDAPGPLDIVMSDEELKQEQEIEMKIIPELVHCHDAWITKSQAFSN
ncbi:DNA/pantothenate metabolism flavoprotein [Polychytrium aggregatum]|uniref:DNA/pantothenate metabolism flavoprotein n=1 Tax=Polychytrium aggregatum TaxID=110093 RepID=UPI0022FEED42|nr:DNA/pantothenate metabolism flavoprotein [Polychytrium aggregatum]KAI9208083.1 DNA/pantothenate metabolism flavoprotein [Polychytrium aggregatum]